MSPNTRSDAVGLLLRAKQALRKKKSAALPKDSNFIQKAVENLMAKGIVGNNGDLSGE